MDTIDKGTIDAAVRAALPFTDRWHNRFHLEMPFGLINDPNGLVHAGGVTHIFYQWNPLGCEHKHKSWAHTTTRDFVHYTVPELSMWPSDAHDKDGCYSGCGLVEDGRVRVLYTCNAKDAAGVRTPAQRFGTLTDDGTIRKEEIILPTNPAGYTGHYRDPYVFYRHGERYLVLGAQREDETGTVLVYHDEGEQGWTCRGEIATKYKDFGYMWECPNLLRFGGYDVLLFCPQGLPAKEYKYQNRFQSGYLVGHLSLESMELMHGRFQELDKGFDFYAPQVFSCEGRHILLGWIGMPDEEAAYPTREKGWMHSLTLPRVLTLRQGKLFSQPARELRALRIAESAVDIDAAETPGVRAELGDGAEVLLDLTFGAAQTVTVTLAYGLERTTLTYDRASQVMTIDRTGMKKGGRGVRRFKLFTDQTLSLQLFVDKTVVEAFFEHGEETATWSVFPEKNIAPELSVTADAPIESVTGRVWELDAIQFH